MLHTTHITLQITSFKSNMNLKTTVALVGRIKLAFKNSSSTIFLYHIRLVMLFYGSNDFVKLSCK